MIIFFVLGIIFVADPSVILDVFSKETLIFLFVLQFGVYTVAALMFTYKGNRMPYANTFLRVHCSAMIAFSLVNLMLMIVGLAAL